MYFRKRLAIVIAAVMISGLFQFDAMAQSARKPVNVPGKTFLPLRVLARPFVNIYQEADAGSKIVEENVPVFQSYFVYTRPNVSTTGTKAEGWYEVGSDNRGTVFGWMKAEDVLEWKQTMCLAYEHPTGRKPVLMFDQLAPLRELITKSSEERVKQTEAYYQQMNKRPLPKDFPVIAMEPEDAIDITKQFYLLPILEYAPIEIEGREGRLLKLASAPKSGIGGGTVKDSATDSMSKESDSTNPEAEVFKKLRIDIVYAVDMTGSMSEYIQLTLETIKDMARLITQDAVLQIGRAHV